MSVVLYSTRYLRIASSLGIPGTLESPRSASIWIKRAGTAAEGTGLNREERILTFGQSVTSQTIYQAARITAADRCAANSFIVAEDTSSGHLIEDTADWHHVVVLFSIRDGSGGEPEFVQCYVDGVADTPDTSQRSGSSSPQAGFWIGADSGTWLGTSTNDTFNGKVAYCAVWDCILSPAEIAELGTKTPDAISYNVNSAGNLRAYWPLVSNLNDASGNGYHMTQYEAAATAIAIYDPANDNPTLDGSPPPPAATLPPFVFFYSE